MALNDPLIINQSNFSPQHKFCSFEAHVDSIIHVWTSGFLKQVNQLSLIAEKSLRINHKTT